MPTFDILKKSDIQPTFRVAKLMADFDVKSEHTTEHFVGQIEMPEGWRIGAIVGGSGTGKTTIAKEVFKDAYICNFEYKAHSVIDDMPKGKSVDEIEKAFYTVGFGSVPSWLKPYSALSNGEKMRVDLARALLEKDTICFDEFTSVVDRDVAKTTCIAVNKAIHRENKRLIVVSCHYDILDWLTPDWVLDTNQMKCFFGQRLGQEAIMKSNLVTGASGQSLGVITI
jgi:ABC-type glutathione transport system ATPase component